MVSPAAVAVTCHNFNRSGRSAPLDRAGPSFRHHVSPRRSWLSQNAKGINLAGICVEVSAGAAPALAVAKVLLKPVG